MHTMQYLFTCCFSIVKLYRQSKLVTTKENNENQSNQMTISNLSLIHFEAFEARLFYISLTLFQSQQYQNVKIGGNIVHYSRPIKLPCGTWWGFKLFYFIDPDYFLKKCLLSLFMS